MTRSKKTEKCSEHINLNCCGQGMNRFEMVEKVARLEASLENLGNRYVHLLKLHRALVAETEELSKRNP